jgi:hypothetical protein
MGIRQRLEEVRDRIAQAAGSVGRNAADVTLVAVSKTMSDASILEAYEAGHRTFGENRVQEFISKAPGLPEDIHWHFVGRLQRNKVKHLAGQVTLIHSVDRLDLAKEIDRRSASPTSVLIEVNVSGESRKAGVEPSDLPSLLEAASELPGIDVKGLMCMAPVGFPANSRRVFRALAEAADRHQGLVTGGIHELSMGMSQDYEVAVEEGATIVRIGEAIFGPRPRPVGSD